MLFFFFFFFFFPEAIKIYWVLLTQYRAPLGDIPRGETIYVGISGLHCILMVMIVTLCS